jgi:threonine dehydratase
MTPYELPTYADVEAAAARIAGVANRTPVHTSRTLNERVGAEVFIKCENFQRMGAFKFRGAFNVAFSSGNHAQGIALSAKILGMPATIVMPHDAPAAKVAATKGYGAHVVVYDRYSEDREAIGRRLADEQGLTLIPPYDHPDVLAGQGTAAKELFEEVGALDYLFVPLGGGGLLSGTALATRALAPQCVLYGVEPEAGNDGQRSLRSGSIVHIDTPSPSIRGAVPIRANASCRDRAVGLGQACRTIGQALADACCLCELSSQSRSRSAASRAQCTRSPSRVDVMAVSRRFFASKRRHARQLTQGDAMKAIPLATRRAALLTGAAIVGALFLSTARADDDREAPSSQGQGQNQSQSQHLNRLPSFIVASSLRMHAYDGVSDDLLTGGLGKTGLEGPAPAIANPAHPTAAELRRLAIWTNYRALVDMTPNGGYGRFWGPNVDLNGNDTLGEGKIPGTEYLAYADNGGDNPVVSDGPLHPPNWF